MGQTQQQPTQASGEVIHWLVYHHASTPNSSFSSFYYFAQPDICSNDYKLS
jgi:hypothetical protein